MYRDGNYNGCLDQLLQMRQLDATMAQKEEALYYIAMATQYSGDDEAYDLLTSFLARFPQSPRYQDVMASIGDFFFTRGNYSDAIRTYSAVNPQGLTGDRAEDLTYRTAYSYMMLGEKPQAIDCFDRLLKTRKYGNAAMFYKAYLAYWSGDYQQAKSLFQQCDTSREPGRAADYYLAQIYFLEGDYSRASRLAQKAISSEANPEFSAELNRINGESLYHLGRPADAIPYLEAYVREAGDQAQPSACYILGQSLYDDGLYERAIPMLQRATISNDAMGQAAYLQLGQCYARTGQKNQALMAFDRAYRMDANPKTTETALYNYIAARTEGGQVPFGQTADILETFLKKYPSSEHVSAIAESLATGYMSTDDYDNTLRVINSARQKTPKMLEARQRALLGAGINAFNTADYDSAAKYFDDGLRGENSDQEVLRQLYLWKGMTDYQQQNQEGAADNILNYLKLAPASDQNRDVAYYTLGYARMDQGRYDDAIEDFNVALSTSDKRMKADALNRIGDARYMKRQYNEAEKSYRRALEQQTDAADYALYQIAKSKQMKRDNDGAIATVDRLAKEYPSSPLLADALMTKADILTTMERPDDAAAVLRQVADRHPETAQGRQAQLQLAQSTASNGNNGDAIAAYREIVSRYPSSDEARQALEQLKTIYAREGRLGDFVSFMQSVPGLPQIEESEIEAAAFNAAESRYLADNSTSLLEKYISSYDKSANAPVALYYLADAAASKGDNEKAIEYSSAIAMRFPDAEVAADALLIKASAESAEGMQEKALDSYRQLERRASTPAQLEAARTGIMVTASELGRNEDVIEVTEQLTSTGSPSTPRNQINFYRALALDRQGENLAESDRLWSELAANPSDLYGSMAAVYLAESQLKRGQAEDARKTADAFTDAGSPYNYWLARGYIVLSDALRQLGHDFEANEYLQTVRSNYPGDESDIFEMIDTRLSEK